MKFYLSLVVLFGLLAGGVVGYFVVIKESQEQLFKNLPMQQVTQEKLALPTTCVDEPEDSFRGAPVITLLSRTSGPVGTTLEIHGCNFYNLGFEGDVNVWIENNQGVHGVTRGDMQTSTKKLINITLASRLCTTDESGRGGQCEWLDLVPGSYKIYLYSLGKKSNEASFMVTALEKTSSVDFKSVVDVAWGIPALPLLPSGFSWQAVREINNEVSGGYQGKNVQLSGITYTTSFIAKHIDDKSDVFAYYADALHGFSWNYFATDDHGYQFVAPTADGMFSGSVMGSLRIQNGQLRAVIWSIGTEDPWCDNSGELPCPARTQKQKVFISDPTNLKDIPGYSEREFIGG